MSNLFNKKYCCFTGSGTTAIYLILKALNLQNKKIVYPTITCMAPVNAAVYAGYEPIFCDVSLNNYTMDLNSLKNILDEYDVGVVVPTHVYGHKCNMKEISKVAHEKGCFVLEDAAQTISLSEFSDASIMSFGHTKILETEQGGGAIFTDDERLYGNLKIEKALIKIKPKNINELFDTYREKYYYIMKNKQEGFNNYKEIYNLQINSKDTFIYDADENNEILEKVKDIDVIIKERNKRGKLYEKYLDNSLVDKAQGMYDVLWRYSFLYKGNREKLLEKVREKNIDISSWYPALYHFYLGEKKQEFLNSKIVEEKIVNLWVNVNRAEEKIKQDIQIINEIMRKV
ncbi:dTDP-4-amino-4,6-dideoxygalactose transaminase [Clostridium cavendishii DSM 21758]|uniref:dTDP-4-amino-4,6-dideoxygalactose transaminase n=2 Tax=Clostridium TaxID=1485 RepID=A0A1M6AX96_9CLOT|nr:dTDP-4-amino-4,6-dideoxygalactose transaminase [Clostridium cavendishii DSM 21758]